jgi:hypothetical protein
MDRGEGMKKGIVVLVLMVFCLYVLVTSSKATLAHYKALNNRLSYTFSAAENQIKIKGKKERKKKKEQKK